VPPGSAYRPVLAAGRITPLYLKSHMNERVARYLSLSFEGRGVWLCGCSRIPNDIDTYLAADRRCGELFGSQPRRRGTAPVASRLLRARIVASL
jgi:hypothetical protein